MSNVIKQTEYKNELFTIVIMEAGNEADIFILPRDGFCVKGAKAPVKVRSIS